MIIAIQLSFKLEKFRHFLGGNNNTVIWSTAYRYLIYLARESRYWAQITLLSDIGQQQSKQLYTVLLVRCKPALTMHGSLLISLLMTSRGCFDTLGSWRSGYSYLNKGERNLNQSKDDSFVERVAKNNS